MEARLARPHALSFVLVLLLALFTGWRPRPRPLTLSPSRLHQAGLPPRTATM